MGTFVELPGDPALRLVGQAIIERINELDERLGTVTDERALGGRTELENMLNYVLALDTPDEPPLLVSGIFMTPEQVAEFEAEWCRLMHQAPVLLPRTRTEPAPADVARHWPEQKVHPFGMISMAEAVEATAIFHQASAISLTDILGTAVEAVEEDKAA